MELKLTTLNASEVGSVRLGFQGPALTASAPSRTLSGYVLVWGQEGQTSIGPVVVPGATAAALPSDLSRVKLVDYHQNPPVGIGYATASMDDSYGRLMTFTVARTPDGDRALLEAVEGARDAFSVELSNLEFEADRRTLRASTQTATALVVVPAFPDARVASVAASHHTTEGTNMLTEEQRARLEALRAQDTRTEAEEAEFRALATLAGETLEPVVGQTVGTEPATPALAASHAGGLAVVPGTLHQGPTARGRHSTSDLYAAMARVARGESRPELEAALSNITQTANVWTSQDEYAGELWSGLNYTRRWVPLCGGDGRALTSYKGTGWRWVTKPEVDDYAGDKTAVPSNAPTTEAVSWAAARLAGAHDFDRKFIDFGDTEFIASYYAAMTDSYARKSDAKAHAALLAGIGTTIAGGAIKLFEAIATGAVSLEDVGGADYIIVAAADFLDLIGFTEGNVPAYLEMLGVDPSKFRSSSSLAAGSVVLGNRQAVAYRELGETPIRVETVDLVNGGVDGGVFGYYTTYETHDAGRVKVTFTGGVV